MIRPLNMMSITARSAPSIKPRSATSAYPAVKTAQGVSSGSAISPRRFPRLPCANVSAKRSVPTPLTADVCTHIHSLQALVFIVFLSLT